MCTLKFTDFVKAGKLVSHEDARANGILHVLDTYQDVSNYVATKSVVFISHQWLGSHDPDPQGVQYGAMVSAVENLIAMHSLDREAVSIWVDFTSIPQKNRDMQRLSISSLPVYASSSNFFVAIAPPAMHQDKKLSCGEETYRRRGWCRLEQMARLALGGGSNMYFFNKTLKEYSADTDEHVLEAMKVREGYHLSAPSVITHGSSRLTSAHSSRAHARYLMVILL